MKCLGLIVSFFVITICLTAETARAIPHCQSCPYSCSDLGLGKKDCSFVSNSGGVCCLDLSNYGIQLAQERERVSGGGGGNGGGYGSQSLCPSGFHPSNSGCSPQERKRGCKDLRGPTGQTCVSGK